MPIFEIEILEFLSKIITIEAETEDEAIKVAELQYKNEEIVLDSSDFSHVEFINITDENEDETI